MLKKPCEKGKEYIILTHFGEKIREIPLGDHSSYAYAVEVSAFVSLDEGRQRFHLRHISLPYIIKFIDQLKGQIEKSDTETGLSICNIIYKVSKEIFSNDDSAYQIFVHIKLNLSSLIHDLIRKKKIFVIPENLPLHIFAKRRKIGFKSRRRSSLID